VSDMPIFHPTLFLERECKINVFTMQKWIMMSLIQSLYTRTIANWICHTNNPVATRTHTDTIPHSSHILSTGKLYINKTPWPLVRKGTIPTERPPHVGEIGKLYIL
jgi:hypothetical protein